MNAIDVLKQSFNFYKNLFNELFWVGLAAVSVPFLAGLMVVMTGQYGLFNVLGMLSGMLVSLYSILYVHQVSVSGERSFTQVFNVLSGKLVPYIKTVLVMMLCVAAAAIPTGLFLVFTKQNPLIFSLLAIVGMLFCIWVFYRISLVVFVTILTDKSGFAAVERSSALVKKNPLFIRVLLVYSLVTLLYIIPVLFALRNWGDASIPLLIVESLLGVFAGQFYSVYFYRAYTVLNEQRPEAGVMVMDFVAPDHTNIPEQDADDNNKPEPK